MRIDVYTYLQKNRELIEFLREQPIWYRKLRRDPSQIENIRNSGITLLSKNDSSSNRKVFKWCSNGFHDG